MSAGAVKQRRARGFRALAVVVAAIAVLAGCTTANPRLPTQTSTPVQTTAPAARSESAADAAAVQKYYTQRLVWKDCGGGFLCTTAEAPIDWSRPSQGAPIHLALIQKPAKGHPIGSLFTNPGGPGESGVDFVRQGAGNASAQLQQSYNVIGWDPRGVGRSTPVTCDSDKQLDDFVYGILPGARGSAEWIAASEKAVAELGQACLKKTGPLLGHVDTASTAHDLDMLRSDVGDAKLNYLGFSYGTMIGALYANMFPKNVGRMTLDGVVDPASSYDDLTGLQAAGFESNLRAYAQWCLTQDKTCPFQGTVDSVLRDVSALLSRVDAHPIKNSDGRMLGANTLLTAVIFPLYATSSWPVLDALFKDVDRGSARVAFYLADQYNNRNSNGHYTVNTVVAFQAINCLDYTFDTNLAHMQAQAKQLAAASPVMGPFFSYGGIACSGWPEKPVRTPGPVRAAGSGPILVLGTTNDPATPYQQSVNLAHELQNGHLVTWNGSGHTAYGRSNSCIQNTVDNYFLRGTVPATDPKC